MTANDPAADVCLRCTPMKRRVFPAEGAGTLAELVARTLARQAEEARALVEAGAVYVAGKRVRDPARAVAKGSAITVVLEERGTSALDRPAPPPLVVLFEDADLLAVAKPAGIPSQPTPSRAGDSLVDLASAHLGRTAGLVHRLDLETSGLTVFGKSSAATSALAAEFREGRARKRYLALTGPTCPERAHVDLPLSRDPSRPGRWRATRAANGLSAETDLVRLFAGPDFALVAALPLTGRTHQIRAHLTALSAPIAGDARYGGPMTLAGEPIRRCLLHAQALRLSHPRTGRPILLEAPPPEDLAAWFSRAGVPVPSGEW
jgi:23S rRNA pseudouridine1911/1915/1917 synthase